MGAFGENLRREREMRGVSLTEIAQTTKIGTRMLDAIESERFDRLPGGIFNSAFVRQYARYLGLDEDRVVAEFEAACGDCAGKTTMQTAATSALRSMASEASRPEPGQPLPLLIAAGLLAAGALVVGGWQLWHNTKPVAVTPTQAAAPQPAPQVPTPAPVTQETPAAAPPAQEPEAQPATKVDPAAAVKATGGLQILLEASARCGIKVSTDGRPEWSTVMKAGDQRNLRAARIVQIQADNAGALTVTRNGQLLPAIGEKGEAKTLTFKVDN